VKRRALLVAEVRIRDPEEIPAVVNADLGPVVDRLERQARIAPRLTQVHTQTVVLSQFHRKTLSSAAQLTPDMTCKVKVKASHTRYRALSPQLIPVYRQSAAGDHTSSTGGIAAITFRQACSYLPSRRASPTFGRYQVILVGDRGIAVNNLPKVVTQRCFE